MHTEYTVFPDHCKILTNHGKKACFYADALESKKNFRRTTQILHCQITGHLSWAPSKVTCQNEQHHKNMEGAENIDSSASDDSSHLSQNPNVYRKRK
jgi:hypothetical protein